jgi:putative ABC transport system permease protein
MPILTIAWRNVWRNRRRSLITAASVSMAVFLIILFESLNEGVFDYLIDNEIRLYTAHIEIQYPGYHLHRRTDQAITEVDKLVDALQDLPYTDEISTRLEMLVIASHEEASSPGLLQGSMAGQNSPFFDYAAAVTLGSASEGGLVLGAGLANSLRVSPGDSVVLVGQSYRGRIAADIYPVSGVIDIPIRNMNDHMLFAPIALVQELADVPDGATSILANLHDKYLSREAKSALTARIDTTTYEVRTWQQTLSARLLNHQLRQLGMSIIKLVLYLIMGFSIFGAIVIINQERMKEYRVMTAIGMKKVRLARMIVLEMLFIASLGLVFGLFLSLPVVLVWHYNPLPITGELAELMARFNVEPVIQMSLNRSIFIQSSMFVFLLTIGMTMAALVVEHFKR